MSEYTLTTDSQGNAADKAIEKVRQRITDGLIEGKQLPLTVTQNGVRIRIQQKEQAEVTDDE